MQGIGSLAAIAAGIVVVFFIFLLWFITVGLWIAATFSGVRVRIFADLVGMRLRRVNPQVMAEMNKTVN